MIVRRRRSLLLVAAVLAVGSLLAPGHAPSTAGSDGACPGTTGVTVVVDYQALGGGIVVRCAGGSPSTGFAALKKAGFAVEEVSGMPGFLCRIDGHPGLEREDCIGTPPGSAYWSYWHASRGGTWKVSAEGGGTRTPPPGSVEGWSFSDDGSPGAASPPGIDPPAKPKPASPKPTATPKPATPKPTATPRQTATPKPVLTARPTDSPSAPSYAPTTSPAPVTPTTTPTSTPTPTPVIAATEVLPTPTVDTAAIAVVGAVSGGSPPFGTLLGIGLVVLISVGAIVTRSRRSAGRSRDA